MDHVPAPRRRRRRGGALAERHPNGTRVGRRGPLAGSRRAQGGRGHGCAHGRGADRGLSGRTPAEAALTCLGAALAWRGVLGGTRTTPFPGGYATDATTNPDLELPRLRRSHSGGRTAAPTVSCHLCPARPTAGSRGGGAAATHGRPSAPRFSRRGHRIARRIRCGGTWRLRPRPRGSPVTDADVCGRGIGGGRVLVPTSCQPNGHRVAPRLAILAGTTTGRGSSPARSASPGGVEGTPRGRVALDYERYPRVLSCPSRC